MNILVLDFQEFNQFLIHTPRASESSIAARVGWGGGIRTPAWRFQKPLPYRLATPQ